MHKKWGLRPFYVLSMTVFLLLIGAFLALPVVQLVRLSFSQPGGGSFSLEHYANIFSSKYYLQSFTNSMGLSLQSALYGLLIALGCSYAVTRFSGERVQGNLLVVINMTSNFAGLPLGFALTLLLGNTGVLIILLQQFGIDITGNFSIYSARGLVIAYTYFQVPLGIMLLYPIYRGIRIEWREAASILGASQVQFWRRVGIPTLLPSIVSTFTVLFANAMGAYATAYYLVSSSYNIVPIRISALMAGDIRTKPELGSALSVLLALVLVLVMLLNDWAIRAAGRRGVKA